MFKTLGRQVENYLFLISFSPCNLYPTILSFQRQKLVVNIFGKVSIIGNIHMFSSKLRGGEIECSTSKTRDCANYRLSVVKREYIILQGGHASLKLQEARPNWPTNYVLPLQRDLLPPSLFLAAKLLYSFRYFVQMNVRPIYFEENAIFSAITARCSKFLVEISNFEEYLLYNLLCLSYICHVLQIFLLFFTSIYSCEDSHNNIKACIYFETLFIRPC